MPRVNRDLQRRMAARRERERRRTPERRYEFGSAPVLETDAREAELEEQPAASTAPAAATRTRPAAPLRGQTQRAAPKPYTAYGPEYAYVGHELRRVALVVGLLLVALIALYFVLPR